MAGFGESIERASKAVDQLLPPEDGDRDWLVDAAIFLALAYASLSRFKARGGALQLAKKLVVLPALERAWQELIHIRVRVKQQSDVARDITITRVGEVKYEGGLTSSTDRGGHRNGFSLYQDWQGDACAHVAERYRSRRDRKRRSAETSGNPD